MIQLLSKETYYKNNPDLLENPEYYFYMGEIKDNPYKKISFGVGDNLYQRTDSGIYFVSEITFRDMYYVYIPKKYGNKISPDDLLRDEYDVSNWNLKFIDKNIPKDQLLNYFGIERKSIWGEEDLIKISNTLVEGVYSLNSVDGDHIDFSLKLDDDSWGKLKNPLIYIKEKSVFPYDKDSVSYKTMLIQFVIFWKQKELLKQ